MKNVPYLVLILISASLLPASAGQNKAINEAGLTLPSVEAPAPETPKSNQWLTLRKITLNEAQPDMNDTLVAKLHRAHNVDDALRELHINGFNARAYQSNTGSYIILVDVKGLDAADLAVGLARYYYITEVQVGQKVHADLFGLNKKSSKANQWLTLRKITLNTAQPEADDTLIGMVQHGQDIDTVVRELTEGGFKVEALQDNTGGYMVMADVKGLDAADLAVGLARYYYISEVKVGQKVLNQLFGLGK